MSSVIAYVLVVLLVNFCLSIGVFVASIPVGLLLAWTSVSLRTKVAGVIAGVVGVAFAVAFGYGVFHFLVGPDSLTVGPFLRIDSALAFCGPEGLPPFRASQGCTSAIARNVPRVLR